MTFYKDSRREHLLTSLLAVVSAVAILVVAVTK